MAGVLSFSESAIEAISLINQARQFNSLFPSVQQNSILVITPRRKKNGRIVTTRSSLSNNGGSVLEKEFEFKSSFDEYLKAMESLKIDRGSSSSTDINRTRKKIITRKTVKEEMEFDYEGTIVREESRNGDFRKKRAYVPEDSRKGMKNSPEKTDDALNLTVKHPLTWTRSASSERKIMNLERAAFESLENENDIISKPRVSKADMDERIQKLAKCLNGADVDMPEWKFSHMMRSAQIKFSDHSIMKIIQILGDLGNWKRVLQVIHWMQSRERFKSHRIRHIYTAALDALGKARRPVEALNLFREMLGQMASYPDIIAYRCIAVTLGQAGYMKELFDVVDTMRNPPQKKFNTGYLEKWDPRLEPDVIIYNAILNACVKRKKWEGAFWVLQQLSETGQQPSSTTYGLVMEVMLACEKYNLVHDFFKKVQRSYIPNALIYKVVVNTLWREGKINEAIKAVEEMERRGIVGTAGLYYDLARCLCSAGRCKEALKQVDKICKVAKKPLVVTYTGLIQACLDSGDVKNGAYVFDHMQKFCSPNLITCNIMLKAFLDQEMFEEAKQLFMQLLDNGNFTNREEDCKVRVFPDIYSFNTMLEACVVKQKWDDVEFVYAQMLRYGHYFNGKRHLRIILDARRAGKDELLEMTWKHLVSTQRVPPPLLITEMFCMRLEQSDYISALSCFTNHASVESHLFSRKSWSNFFTENGHRFEKGTLVKLMHETSIILARSENPILQNLMESCEVFLSSRRTSREFEGIPVASRLAY